MLDCFWGDWFVLLHDIFVASLCFICFVLFWVLRIALDLLVLGFLFFFCDDVWCLLIAAYFDVVDFDLGCGLLEVCDIRFRVCVVLRLYLALFDFVLFDYVDICLNCFFIVSFVVWLCVNGLWVNCLLIWNCLSWCRFDLNFLVVIVGLLSCRCVLMVNVVAWVWRINVWWFLIAWALVGLG